MKLPELLPQNMEGQLVALLVLSFSLLLTVLAVFEFLEYDDVVEWSQGEQTISRLGRMKPIIASIKDEEAHTFINQISRCHEGYTLTEEPYPVERKTIETQFIEEKLAGDLNLASDEIQAGFSVFEKNDFSYSRCASSEIKFPVNGIVISMRVAPRMWLNAEVHPHEWHFTPSISDWLMRSGAAFFVIGGAALLFVRRLSQPINSLTNAARAFGDGLRVEEVKETGPLDTQRAIRSFNAMQRQVTEEVKRRTNFLAGISHDLRSPLTALRVKAELVEDAGLRTDIVRSVSKMERLTASALEFLKGESREEPKRMVDLAALIESEASDFRELGAYIRLELPESYRFSCRPNALARAIRNIIENSIKYAGAATVSLYRSGDYLEISVSDTGPGVPDDKLHAVLEPFERLSPARESGDGGFGLGLAIAKAVAEGHEGELILKQNKPAGLVVTVRLPAPIDG